MEGDRWAVIEHYPICQTLDNYKNRQQKAATFNTTFSTMPSRNIQNPPNQVYTKEFLKTPPQQTFHSAKGIVAHCCDFEYTVNVQSSLD